MKTIRKHSEDFKKQAVSDILSGVLTKTQFCREHKITPSLVYKWQKKIRAAIKRTHQ